MPCALSPPLSALGWSSGWHVWSRWIPLWMCCYHRAPVLLTGPFHATLVVFLSCAYLPAPFLPPAWGATFQEHSLDCACCSPEPFCSRWYDTPLSDWKKKTNEKLRGALPNAAWWECTEGETQISQRKRTKETFLSCFLLGGGQRWEREAPMPFPIRNNCSSLLWPGFDSLKVPHSVNLTKWGMSI